MRARDELDNYMKRDMDLIRQILFKVEDAPDFNFPVLLKITEYSEEEITYHVKLLAQAGYIDARSIGQDQWRPLALTWQGCEFLDAARNDEHWGKAKEVLAKAGGQTFEILKMVLVAIITKNLS